MLEEFKKFMEQPQTLSFPCNFGHQISLYDESKVVNLSPYAMPTIKKKIEKHVADLLKSGLIRHSTSPFSSPVLLVWKKDWSLRLCTDYRSLNDASIMDRFSIPTMDVMLDELYGAKFFSKLDFWARYHQIRVHSDDIHKIDFQLTMATTSIFLCLSIL